MITRFHLKQFPPEQQQYILAVFRKHGIDGVKQEHIGKRYTLSMRITEIEEFSRIPEIQTAKQKSKHVVLFC